jgi:predicted butyrate kinase (DUF1464 family)
MALRVAGTDPGTSSLDVVIVEDNKIVDQHRFAPEVLAADPTAPVRWLQERGPLALVAGPSGYGLPLVRGRNCSEQQMRLMSLVRPDDTAAQGVAGFSRLVEAFCRSSLEVVFLPGVVHLPTVPPHRKINRIDLGTADKVCVTALALGLRAGALRRQPESCSLCLVEMGSAFTACVVVQDGRIVDGLGGTCGPMGYTSGGSWDGEVAYLLSPLTKQHLFRGGVHDVPDAAVASTAFRERLIQAVAGLRAVTAFDEVVLTGRLLETQSELANAVTLDLARFVPVVQLGRLSDAWVKHAAVGAAAIANGLLGGAWSLVVEALQLTRATGTVLDGLLGPRPAGFGD